MNVPDFRKVFNPVQPGVTSSCKVAVYSESVPEPRLSQYIYCYWRLRSTNKLSTPFFYRVIPDGCIDIFFNMNNTYDAHIMGFSTMHTEFNLEQSFDYAGVRFMPGAFPHIFNLDASSLTDRDENLFDVVPLVAKDLAEQLELKSRFEKILDNYFLKKLESIKFSQDKRLYNAIQIVLGSHGNINLKSDIDTGISHRQLRRLFKFYIGETPKMFSKVIRFQYFFQLLSSEKGCAYNKLFYEAGYYDQPHFNKDFKIFFGLTPGEALVSPS